MPGRRTRSGAVSSVAGGQGQVAELVAAERDVVPVHGGVEGPAHQVGRLGDQAALLQVVGGAGVGRTVPGAGRAGAARASVAAAGLPSWVSASASTAYASAE